MAQKSNLQNRPKVQYRVELEKKIEINKSYSERRNQAIALRILSYGLFGQKRYQNLYLSCSLNCFYYGLKIANTMHNRVPGLAMIIRFQQAHVIEYYSEPFEGKTYGEKKYSKINIKLTKTPTEEDKKEPGYNPGLNADDIEQPLTDVIARKDRGEGSERRRGGFRRFNRGGGRYRGGYRRPYEGGFREGGFRGERQVRGERQDRQRGTDYNKYRNRPNRYDDRQENNDRERGQPRTRGGYSRGYNNDRNQGRNFQNRNYNRDRDDERSFERRRRGERGEDRGAREPRGRRNRQDDD